MPSLRISEQQAAELSDDLVRRHARSLSRRAGDRAAADEPLPADLPADAGRLKALHAVLRSDLQAKAGAVAPFLAVDLEHCARQLLRALQAGAAYRETAAAALMSAAASLGASWLSDERLCVDGDESVPALPEPREAGDLRKWAEASWAERHRLASRRNRAVQMQVRYALSHAIEGGNIDSIALRSLADAVFDFGDQERLRRFLDAERALIAAARLDSASLGDRRVESLCLAGDLAFGLGRFVRLAASVETGKGPPVDTLLDHLGKALDALAK